MEEPEIKHSKGEQLVSVDALCEMDTQSGIGNRHAIMRIVALGRTGPVTIGQH